MQTIKDTHTLDVDTGTYTTQGIKPHNEDAVGVFIPSDIHELTNKGICALVADGVSTAGAGKEASDTTVSQFIDDYYNTPDTWSVSNSAEKIISAINLKLYRQSHAYRTEGKGYLCTLCATVIKSRTAHIFHVGDSRVYLLRKGELKKLTEDHCVVMRQGQEFLSRAVGMDSQLHIDYSSLSLEEDDILLSTTDGVHGFISDQDIIDILSEDKDADTLAQQLCEFSLKKESDDNISAVVVKIKALDNENIDDFNARLNRLPFPPDLEPGMKIDDLLVLEEIYASSRSQLYKVRDTETGNVMVMKTPSVNYKEDNHYLDRFIQEEWIGKRITSNYIVDVINLHREKHFLYYLLEWIDGVPLNKWIEKNPKPDPTVAINIVEQIALGLSALHRNDTTHQDLRPANIMIDKNNQIKIVDFGSVFVASIAEIFIPIKHEGALGTASYADPKYLLGQNTTRQGDLYSLATIAYELFTGALPYGDSIEECRTALEYDHLRYHSATKHNAIIPIWFDRALEKGVKFSLEDRYKSIADFISDLKNPNADFLRDDPKVELTKSPLLFWQAMSGFWILMLLIMAVMFSS